MLNPHAYAPIYVHRNRTNKVLVSTGLDLSNEVVVSEIRVDDDVSSTLIATWDVGFVTDGTDGELVLTLDDTITASITRSTGYWDMKRVSGGEPLSIFDRPIPVVFLGVVTE